MAKIAISEDVLQDYLKTSVKWNTTLMDLPIRKAQDVLMYMRGITGLRGAMMLPAASAKSQFAPFKKTRKSDADVNIKYRKLETFLGNAVEEFSPVDYAKYAMGYTDAISGEAIKGASTTALVLMMLSKAKGEGLAQCAFTGVYNPEGDTTEDLCDGLLTIAANEIKAGTITAEIGNYIKLQDKITNANACDLLKEEVLFKINPFLRRENNLLLCDPAIADMYNESYLSTHNGLVYNTQYDQPYLEGSGKRITIVGLPEMAGQKRIILTQKENMLWGTDNKSDETGTDIMRKDHYTLSFEQHMWFGMQFHTIDPRRLCIVDLADEADDIPSSGGSTETGTGSQTSDNQ